MVRLIAACMSAQLCSPSTTTLSDSSWLCVCGGGVWWTETGSRQSRGVGFVIMDTYANALAAIQGLHSKMVEGGTKKLVVKVRH
jgi:hypothetical protein